MPVEEAIAVTRYRKLPALKGGSTHTSRETFPAAKEGHCARVTGHTLIVRPGRIECQSCGATWKDFGY